MDDPVSSFIDHLKRYVEQPHPAFSGLPVCPFARRARVKNLILFKVMPLSADDVVAWVLSSFVGTYEVAVALHPSRTLSGACTAEIATEVTSKLAGTNFVAFWGHPEATFTTAGTYSRREPYPNIQVIKRSVVARAEAILATTKYYNGWSEAERNSVRL